ncbi:MAG: biotin carboxylase N-terminal domain-containing protein [Pseudomonadota bacterium]
MTEAKKKASPRFSRVLIANRGEIACRIIRTVRACGYTAIAVYSDADADAPHVSAADLAVRIGGGPVADSYLSIERLLDAAASSGAQAIHPGYGFLSENPSFARACDDAGLVFIGPSASATELMGNKAVAKQHMLAAGVPCVPGYQGDKQSNEELTVEASRLGLPLMIKAASGGGGRGMRLINEFAQIDAALDSARSEAEEAFGSGELILEKAVPKPRHVEIQVFADSHGNTINLGERDCSVQRRHQKVLEEAPCPAVNAELRLAMGAAAVTAAKSIAYCGAGTVEFLLDQDGNFYFLEMNTRLQVEHPVTEMVTGLDLVKLQLDVAQGDELKFDKGKSELTGHAIEARIYAEDPGAEFLPTTGQVVCWKPPVGEGVRVDSGIQTGSRVSPFYDPMLAKIVAWGDTRDAARQRLLGALQSCTLLGLRTNLEFLADCLQCEQFVSGEVSTAFIEENRLTSVAGQSEPDFFSLAVAGVIQHVLAAKAAADKTVLLSRELLHFGSAHTLAAHRHYQSGERLIELVIKAGSATIFDVSDSRQKTEIELESCADGSATLRVDGQAVSVEYALVGDAEIWIKVNGSTIGVVDQISRPSTEADSTQTGQIRAPMHGQVIDVSVVEGEFVERGQPLLRMEAMKMQHEIVATVSGVVKQMRVVAGAQVVADALLADIESDGSAESGGPES